MTSPSRPMLDKRAATWDRCTIDGVEIPAHTPGVRARLAALDMGNRLAVGIAEGIAGPIVVTFNSPGGGMAAFAARIRQMNATLLPMIKRALAPIVVDTPEAAERYGIPMPAVALGVGGRRGRRRRRAEERRALALREALLAADDAMWGPYVCPGCYAIGGEKCAAHCPDAAIERDREERCDRDPDDYRDDGASL